MFGLLGLVAFVMFVGSYILARFYYKWLEFLALAYATALSGLSIIFPLLISISETYVKVYFG